MRYHLCNKIEQINDYFAQAIQTPLPARLPESNSEKRETRINNDRFSNTLGRIHSGIDYIVPMGEGVSKHHDLYTLILFTY